MKMLKQSGLFLLLFMVMMLVLSTVLFFLHVSITKLHLIIAFFITSGIYYLVNRKNNTKKDFISIIGLALIVIFSSTLISTFMFDRSSDGNTYHKDAIGVLKEGFNPVYESSLDFIESRDGNRELSEYSIWTDHYAKANWIIAANFYSLTGNVESGKAMNFISLYIVFSLIFTTVIGVLDKKKAFIISILTVINPVTGAQLFTYYNDQLVCLYLFLAILFLIKLDYNIKDKESWVGYILTFIILANMKFNGLGYLLVFSFLFVCRYLYKAWKKQEFILLFKKLCLIFIPLFVVSLVVVGYPTYIKNTIDHSNPFFPLYDDNGEDIITAQQPKTFLEMNNLEKLFYGTFSKANNLREHDKTELKVPFMVYKDEIVPAISIDLRISGWGILFSGILLCSLVILIKYYKVYKQESWILYTLGITVFLLILMSESWWARYTPHFYLFIILSLYVLLKYGKLKIINLIYLGLITINTLLPLAGNTYYTLKNSIEILGVFNNLKDNQIMVNEKGMNGVIYNLKDFNIDYKIDNSISGEGLYYNLIEYKVIKK